MLTEILIDLTWKFPLVCCLISLVEYLMHKYMLHGKWLYNNGPRWLRFSYFDHAIGHHGRDLNDVLPYIDLTVKDYFALIPFMIIAFVRFTYFGHIGGLSSLIAQLLGCTVHMVLWNKMHRAIHGLEPNNWASKLPWYNFIKRHHEGHHKDPRRNLNVVFPLFDYLLGNVYKEPK